MSSGCLVSNLILLLDGIPFNLGGHFFFFHSQNHAFMVKEVYIVCNATGLEESRRYLYSDTEIVRPIIDELLIKVSIFLPFIFILR